MNAKTITLDDLPALVARMRAAQVEHGRICRVFYSSHEATITKELEAAVDKAVADLLLGVKEDEQRRELARAADEGNPHAAALEETHP